MLVTRRPQSDPELIARLDPGFWRPAYQRALAKCSAPLAELGEFITAITYGPIVTGKRAPECAEGVTIIHQGQVAVTGVDPRGATRVAEGSDWDLPRARLQTEDIVLPRSGVASVAKNRVSIFLADYPAVVGSFVDLIRIKGIDPIYAMLCLKSTVVWAQIHRIISGVGTPNISFDEVRSLRIPLLPEGAVRELRRAYLEEVHARHVQWLGGSQTAGDAGAESLRALVARLNAATFDDGAA